MSVAGDNPVPHEPHHTYHYRRPHNQYGEHNPIFGVFTESFHCCPFITVNHDAGALISPHLDALSEARYDALMWATKPYRDAVAIQTLIANDAKDEECDPKTRCLLARAYKELEELKLRLKMKPAPKPVDVSKLQKPNRRSQPSQSFEES